MKLLFIRVIFLFIFTSLVNISWGVIDIKITQGVDSAQPIIVNNFITTHTQDKISEIIKKDLIFGGDFKLISPNFSLNKIKLDAKTIDYLRNSGADGFITGTILKEKDGDYKVGVKLYNIYDSKHKKHSLERTGVLKASVSESFEVLGAQLPALAHHISDLIFKQMTGQQGYYSTKIAYVRASMVRPIEYSLEVADYNGENSKAILVSKEPILSPAWSQDAKNLAYVSLENKHSAIFISNLRTGKRTLISNSSGMNSAPAWSPDGSKLAFVLSKNGYPKIFIKNLVSGKLQQLTQGYSIDTEPKWSNNDNKLLFTSNRGGYPQIYQYSFVSNRVERITFDGKYNVNATYSPDNTYIAFNHGVGNIYYIAVMDLLSKKTHIISSGRADESPTISPNGRGILFSKLQGDKRILMFVNKYGNYRRTVLSSRYELLEPAWSPFYF